MVRISRQEPLGAEDRGQLGLQHLDGDLAVVLAVVGEVDGRHAALAELTLDLVFVGQGGVQSFEEFGHSAGGLQTRSQYRSLPAPAASSGYDASHIGLATATGASRCVVVPSPSSP